MRNYLRRHVYIWWTQTAKEFDLIKKITKSDIPPVWKKIAGR